MGRSILQILLTVFACCVSDSGKAQEVFLHDGTPLTVEKSLLLSEQKEREGDKKEASRFRNIAASMHWEKRNYAEAARLYRQSLELNQAIGNANGITMIHNNLGMICADMREYDQALFHFEQTLAARRLAKQKLSMVAALVNLSVVFNNLNRHAEAVQRLEEALLLATEMNDAKQMRSCYGMLAETYEKLGNQAKTLEYFNLYRTFHELEQRTKETAYTQETQRAQLTAQLAEAARRNKELELAANQRELTEKQMEISAYGLAVDKLMASSSKQDLALALLRQENRIKELALQQNRRMTAQKQQLLEHEHRLRVSVAIALAVTMVLLAGLLFFYVQKRKANRQLEHSNREILRQHSEISRQADQLSEQAQKLQETNALKDKLFSIVSHDMRGPLGTLKSMFSLINDRTLNQEEFYALAGRLQESVEGVYAMMENLLHWAYAQMEGFTTKPQSFGLQATVEQVVHLYARTAEAKNIRMEMLLVPGATVFADPEQIHLVLRNLVGNALKFTPEGGCISIAATAERENAERENMVLCISDTGTGMDPDRVRRLFTASHDTERGTAGEKGTGLGLMLCKEFAERNGGQIWVESQQGQGSTFFVRLPVPVLTPMAAAVPDYA